MKVAKLAAVVAVGLLAACGAPDSSISIEHAWSPPTPPDVRVAAVYLQITSPQTDVLLGASSPLAERVEMHMTSMEDGMMRMRPIERVELPAGETVRFEPGGRHFMVMGLDGPLAVGSTLPLELEFESAGVLKVAAVVQASGEHAH